MRPSPGSENVRPTSGVPTTITSEARAFTKPTAAPGASGRAAAAPANAIANGIPAATNASATAHVDGGCLAATMDMDSRNLSVDAAARIDSDWKPQVEFRQSFVIAHPVDEVWAFFGRLEDVAAWLPGASLDGGEEDGVVNGKMKVKVGPISAEFSGVAQITRDEAAHRGAIVGSGRDTRSNSATRRGSVMGA